MSASYLQIENVDMTFTKGSQSSNVLSNINLKVNRGEFISLIGHSGCGKSTVLNIIAGLLNATSGVVILDGKEVNDPGPDRSVVFQNHSLLPWLTPDQVAGVLIAAAMVGRLVAQPKVQQ